MKFTTLQRYKLDQIQTCDFANGSAQYFSLCGNGHAVNEDGLLLGAYHHQCQFMLVADGMGGHPGGDEAVEIILETYKKKYARSKAIVPDTKLFQVLDSCNRTVMAHKKDTGSTLCLALLQAASVQFFCVGDSLGMVLDANQEVKYATVEENSIAMADEIGVVPQEPFLLNYVGYERISYQVSPQIPIQKGDQIFLMTDGAHEFFEQEDEKNIEHFMQKLVEIRASHRLDDATCICLNR
ncbi:MAG: protein phosphatase 2C domain-containing protein [Deltaproteobacteria bacterium]|nr:protein phosphatase 2C domain-containing protein [Deltaproteobacteria bacterium]